MTMANALRLVTIAIAIAGLADPAVTLSWPSPRPLTITMLETPSLVLPDGAVTRRERALRAAETIRAGVATDYDVTIRTQTPGADAEPCPEQGACVVVSDGARPRILRRQVSGGVTVGTPVTPNVAVDRVDTDLAVDSRGVALLTAHLSSRGLSGHKTDVKVFDRDMLVGHVTHAWPADPPRSFQYATVDVPWTPIVQEGFRNLRVVATPIDAEVTTLDNEAQIGVDVAETSSHVLFYSAQPVWGSTFVRRALEDSGRFTVSAFLGFGRVSTGAKSFAPLTAAALERRQVGVLIVATPELLSAREVEVIDQFARVRGGSVLILLNGRPSKAVAPLLPPIKDERVATNPVAVGMLRATELVTFVGDSPASTVLAFAGSDPVVVSRAVGRGRIIVSGAVDAWRYREEGNRFSAFWSGVVADAAQAAGARFTVTLSKTVVTPGEPVAIDVEWRSMEPLARAEIRGVIACQQGPRKPMRLWPGDRPGRFHATFVATDIGECQLDVRFNNDRETAHATFLVTRTPAVISASAEELAEAITINGGTIVRPGDESALVTRLRQAGSAPRVSTRIHPVRPPWWILPFAACLGGEWWLRRRKGLR